MTPTTLSDPRSAAQEIGRRHREPEGFLSERLAALEAYLGAPLPDRVLHLWRYTDPALFVPPDEALPFPSKTAMVSPPSLPDGAVEQVASGTWSGVVVSDAAGTPQIRLSSEAEKRGVVVMDLHEALRSRKDIVGSFLGRLVGRDASSDGRGKFEALNFALWSAGTFVHVPRNVIVEKPLHLFLSLPGGAGPAFLATRLLVVVEEGAELTVVDECSGGHEGLTLESVFELFAGPNSRLRHVAVQGLERAVTYHVTQRVSVGRDSNLLTATASLGSGITKSSFGSFLDGPGAHVELVGFLCAEGKQQFDHHTMHDHRSGHTTSNLDFKVVLKDRARSAYTGLIRIEKEAPGCEAYQENRNLLLSEGAKAESIPELEILNDDVKCTHGATVGTLDPEHLFYLMCRGLPRPDAIRLIVGGFIEPTLSRVPEDLRERLRSHVEERIKDL